MVAGYLGGPFFTSFVPVDAFEFGGFVPAGAEVPAVLGERADAEVSLPVVIAVVVDVVDDEMVGGVCDLAVHFDALAVFFSHGVAILVGALGKPGIFAQGRIVLGIDDGEFPSRQGYEARHPAIGIGGSRRVEVRALLHEPADFPLAFGAFFLPAYQNGPARTGGERRKATIITSFFAGHWKSSPRQRDMCQNQWVNVYY